MSEEKKRKASDKLKISILGQDHGILIGRAVIRALGMPSYIGIFKGTDKQSIAIAPCDAGEYLSFKVPKDYAEVNSRKFRVYSHSFTEELIAANGLEPGKTHKVLGTYSDKLHAVVFPLRVY